MPTPFDPAKMGAALQNFFTNGTFPAVGPPKPNALQRPPQQPNGPQGNFGKSQQPPPPSYGQVPFQDALRALGPPMDNGQAYTNPQAFQGYQNAARAVAAMYGMQPNGYFNNARPEAFRPMPGMQQANAQQPYGPFNAQFRSQFAPQRPIEQTPFGAEYRAQGTGPAPNPTVR